MAYFGMSTLVRRHTDDNPFPEEPNTLDADACGAATIL
jgi:hypothetical protein